MESGERRAESDHAATPLPLPDDGWDQFPPPPLITMCFFAHTFTAVCT